MTKTIGPSEDEIKMGAPEEEEPEIVDPLLERLVDRRLLLMDEQIAILSGTHPLFAVYKSGKHWRAEYRGKDGRLNWNGNSAAEGLLMVEKWRNIVTD